VEGRHGESTLGRGGGRLRRVGSWGASGHAPSRRTARGQHPTLVGGGAESYLCRARCPSPPCPPRPAAGRTRRVVHDHARARRWGMSRVFVAREESLRGTWW
jgi:hypothetical protein